MREINKAVKFIAFLYELCLKNTSQCLTAIPKQKQENLAASSTCDLCCVVE